MYCGNSSKKGMIVDIPDMPDLIMLTSNQSHYITLTLQYRGFLYIEDLPYTEPKYRVAIG